MKVDKLSVSFDPDLGDAVRAAAKRAGGGLSRWLAEAAAAKLRAEALVDILDAWVAEHGPLTAAELATAAAELGQQPTAPNNASPDNVVRSRARSASPARGWTPGTSPRSRPSR